MKFFNNNNPYLARWKMKWGRVWKIIFFFEQKWKKELKINNVFWIIKIERLNSRAESMCTYAQELLFAGILLGWVLSTKSKKTHPTAQIVLARIASFAMLSFACFGAKYISDFTAFSVIYAATFRSLSYLISYYV